MRILNQHRPSVMKRVAPYRGVSDRDGYVNGMLEVGRDLRDLEKVIVEGQGGGQESLMRALVAGEGEVTGNGVMASGEVVTSTLDAAHSNLSNWTLRGGATRTKTGETWRLVESGLLDPAGVTRDVAMRAGESYLMVLRLVPVSGKVDELWVGADRINGSGSDLRKVDLTGKTAGLWLDKRLYSEQDQTVRLALWLHKGPSVLAAAEILVERFEIYRLESTALDVQGMDRDMRRHLETGRRLQAGGEGR